MLRFSKYQLETFIHKFILLVLIFYAIVVLSAFLADLLNLFEFDKINNVLIEEFLINREGILVSLAAIFIGIYISVFTILLTVKSNSLIVELGEEIYKELVSFLVKAILGATLYIIYVIFYPLFVKWNINGFTKFLTEALLGGLVIYMLLTSVRILLAFILLFKNEINNIFKNIEKENIEVEEIKKVIFKVKHIVDEYEGQKSIKKSEEINNVREFKNPKNPQKPKSP